MCWAEREEKIRSDVYFEDVFVMLQVGKIFFDSRRECKDDCYVGLPTVTPGEKEPAVYTFLQLFLD